MDTVDRQAAQAVDPVQGTAKGPDTAASALGPPCALWRFFTALGVAAFAMNWLWEMVQMPAYAEMARRPWRETALPCTLATVGDVVVTFSVYGLGALAAGRLRWGAAGGWNVYAAAALLGGATAVGIEWRALATGRWSYGEAMPVVPALGVGLWPLLQLALLVPGAFWVARWWAGRASGRMAPLTRVP